jgi:cyanate lyase
MKEASMDREHALATIRASRREKRFTFQALAQTVGCGPVYLAAVLHGQQRLGAEASSKLAKALDLKPEVVEAVTAFPVRTEFPITTDPFKYRLMEIVGVYGDSLRDMANEMFGDGIMSAIDFTLDMEKVTGTQGEARVKITMNGKWLPYKEF